MAKSNKSNKGAAVVVKSNRGGGSIDEQIAKLKATLTKTQIAQAEDLVQDESNHAMLRYAFKIMPKASTRALVLSKRELAEYGRIAAIDKRVAEQWKESILAGKAEKRQTA